MRALPILLILAAVPAQAHDIYTGLKNERGQDCCHNIHCRPVGACILPDHHEGVMIGELCTPIPEGALVKEPSPDGNSHACIVGGQLRCVWLGAGV